MWVRLAELDGRAKTLPRKEAELLPSSKGDVVIAE